MPVAILAFNGKLGKKPVGFVAESELHLLLKYLRHAEGSTAVEYGLIAGIIGGALILGIGAFSDNMSAMFTMISDLIHI